MQSRITLTDVVAQNPGVCFEIYFSVADLDLQIRGRTAHPDPEIRGAPGLKNFFSALQASVWCKSPLPRIRHCFLRNFL